MRLVYLPQAQQDLNWFVRYYREAFPDGAAGAARGLEAAEVLLAEHPFAGPPQRRGRRRLRVGRTPFSLIYRVRKDRIEVLGIQDGRSRGVAR